MKIFEQRSIATEFGFLEVPCGETNKSLARYAEIIDLDGIPVRTLSLEGLLLTKQSVRDKDVMDRMVLQRAIAVAK